MATRVIATRLSGAQGKVAREQGLVAPGCRAVNARRPGLLHASMVETLRPSGLQASRSYEIMVPSVLF